jgi:Holliday junction resolvase RusA-like endonuclease
MTWRCYVPGEPVARAEKRVTYRTRDGRTINKLADKDHVADYKSYVKGIIAIERPERLLDGPLSLAIWVYRQRPRSAPRRVIYPTTRPDWTNYAKLIEDCLKSIVIRDDSLVVSSRVEKRFALDGHTPPGVYIEVCEIAATTRLRPSHLWSSVTGCDPRKKRPHNSLEPSR